MDDRQILGLFNARDESALTEMQRYSAPGKALALRMLGSLQDAEEVLNDAMLRLWESIPPAAPKNLCAYLMTVVRNLACDRLREAGAKRRGGSAVRAPLDELAEVIPSSADVEAEFDSRQMSEAVAAFLDTLPKDRRVLFMQRYWAMMPVKEIAAQSGMKVGTVTSTLKRTRDQLHQYLEERGLLE